MYTSINSILLSRKNKILKELGSSTNIFKKQQITTLLVELSNLGYTLSIPAQQMLNSLSSFKLKSLHKEIIHILSELKGVKNYQPMYPNFPTQVMEMNEAELYFNAIIHYLSVWATDVTGENFVWLPKYNKKKRQLLEDKVKLTVIDVAEIEEFVDVMHNLISSNTSISNKDKEDIKYYLVACSGNLNHVHIKHKEILAFVASVLLKEKAEWKIEDQFKTATDVLRLAVAMSDGDVSLAEVTKFRNFTRPERRWLLSLIEKDVNAAENMLKHKNRWIRLGERLHPGEYKQFPNTLHSFDLLRNNIKFVTFNSEVERLMTEDVIGCAKLLSTRPGYFARRLDELLRKSHNPNLINSIFKEVANKVATPVLLQVLNHFEYRNNDNRYFFPKGNIAKLQTIPNNLPLLSYHTKDEVEKSCRLALIDKFSKLPHLGTCYLDDNLKDFPIPFSQRSASDGFKSLVRGSKVPFDCSGKTARFFIWWKDIAGERVDLDLSAMMYDENFNLIERIAYFNLKSEKYQSAHSGDITSAPNGACEFIDIDCDSVVKYGGRYVMMVVNSYTRQSFKLIPEVSAGWMSREKPKSGEIFEPKTVQNKIKVTTDSKMVVPLIIDLVDKKVIWADLSVKENLFANNVANNKATLGMMAKALIELKKPSLYTLFLTHIACRGHFVSDKKDANTIFSLDEGVTPYDIDTIVGKYLV